MGRKISYPYFFLGYIIDVADIEKITEMCSEVPEEDVLKPVEGGTIKLVTFMTGQRIHPNIKSGVTEQIALSKPITVQQFKESDCCLPSEYTYMDCTIILGKETLEDGLDYIRDENRIKWLRDWIDPNENLIIRCAIDLLGLFSLSY